MAATTCLLCYNLCVGKNGVVLQLVLLCGVLPYEDLTDPALLGTTSSPRANSPMQQCRASVTIHERHLVAIGSARQAVRMNVGA